MNRTRRFGRTALRTGLGGLLAMTLVLEGNAIAAGQTGCGEYSYGFEGTRLFNDGISDSAGPFTIVLPAGTYDVTLVSYDAHDEHPGQDEQTQEQFFVVLDSGYTSPPSTDIPLDINNMTTLFAAQEVGASTAISVQHLGQGGINSLDVVCVGFTAVTVADPEPDPDPDPEPDPEVAGPDVEVADPEPEVADPEPEPEAVVKSVVQTPTPQLARTGPPTIVLALAGAGLFLLGYGTILMNLEAIPARAGSRRQH